MDTFGKNPFDFLLRVGTYDTYPRTRPEKTIDMIVEAEKQAFPS